MKLDRLLSITMILLNNDMITAKELAEKFEVSIRTIYRDIDAINAAGIPIVSYQGNSGGFSIMDGFKIDKRLLSFYDIESLIEVLRGISSIFKNDTYDKTLTLLESLDINSNKQILSMDFSSWSSLSPLNKTLNLIRKAIENSKIISFNYTSITGENTSREIEPITLLLKSGYWYLHGYCKTRKDCRLFKLSRMRSLTVTDTSFILDNSKLKDIKYYWEETEKISFLHMELKFTSKASAKAMDYFFSEDLSFNEDGSLTIKVCYPEDQWLYSTLLSFGAEAQVISPPHLREVMKLQAKKILKLYE